VYVFVNITRIIYIFKNQKNWSKQNIIQKVKKTRILSGANSYMCRHQGATLKEFIKNKCS